MLFRSSARGQGRPGRPASKRLGEEHLTSISPQMEEGARERAAAEGGSWVGHVAAEVGSWVGHVFLNGRLVFVAVFEGLEGEVFQSASPYGMQSVVRAYVRLTAAQLLDYSQFRAAVLEQFGLFFSSPTVERAAPWDRDAVWRELVMAKVDEEDALMGCPRPGDALPADNALWSFWIESREDIWPVGRGVASPN
jgi:hypothetical protein